MGDRKIFEDFTPVDCNECSHYWDSSCDGASKGSRVACNSYSATRSVVIPAKLNAVEKRVKWLGWAVVFECIILGILFIVGWLIG